MYGIVGDEFQLIDSESDIVSRVENIIDEVVGLEEFEAIAIMDSRFLHNKKHYPFGRENFVLLSSGEDIIRLKHNIALSCIGSGHMSVLFAFRSDEKVLSKFLEHYARNKMRVFLGDGGIGDPLSKDQRDDFLASINWLTQLPVNIVFVFSHDAEYLYRIETTGEHE